MSCDVTTSIALFDARRGMVIAKLPLSVRDGCEQGRPALLAPGRDVELQKLLTELGIIGTSFETARSVSLRDDGTRGVRLPRSKLGVVEGGQGVNVLRGNTTVATGPKSEPRLIGATFVPDAHLLVIESYRPIDGCPDNGLDALVLPP
jgi:hypothetical protein